MSYLLNYKQWRAIHEAAVFEAKDSTLPQVGIGPDLVPVLKGNAIYDVSEPGVTPAWGWLDTANTSLLFETLSTTVGFGGIPKLFINAGIGIAGGWASSKTGSEDSLMDVFKLLICGIGRFHGIKNLGDELTGGTKDGKLATERVADLGLKVVQDGEFQLYGADKVPNSIQVSHKIINDGTELDSTKPINSNDYRAICNYINTFNLINFAEGNSQQYASLTLDKNKVLQLGNQAEVTLNETVLYLYSPVVATTTAAGSEEVKTFTSGKAGLDESLTFTYSPNEFATATTAKGEKLPVNKDNPVIQAVAGKIIEALGEDQQITSMTLTSGASPDWQGVPVPESNGTGDPSGGKLTDSTYRNEKSALGNQYLAWRRGKQFVDALVELLGEKRIVASGVTINWQVKKAGGEGGRNISYSVKSTGVAPKEKIETQFVAATRSLSSGAKKLYRYKFTWNWDKMSSAELGWMAKLTGGLVGKSTTGYGDLKVGDFITYKGMITNKNGDQVVTDKKDFRKTKPVFAVRDGVVYVESEATPGKEIMISTDRFLKGGKTKVEAYVE